MLGVSLIVFSCYNDKLYQALVILLRVCRPLSSGKKFVSVNAGMHLENTSLVFTVIADI